MKAALVWYRVFAYVVGVWLLLLVLVAMPLKYAAHDETLVAIVGPVHGFLYMVYLVAVLHLGTKARWPLLRTVLVMLAGTIPFLSFVAERRVARRVRRGAAV